MEDVQANNVEFVLKSVDDQNMIIQDPKEINDQCNLKTTGYLLDVTSNPIAAGSQDGQFVTADAICQDNQGTQFVTLEVENTDQIILQEKEVILWNDICRICANGSDRFIPIFTGDGLEHDLCTKIQTYLPLQVSEEDSLPHQICYNCAATLLAWHDIYKGCIDAQQRLIELQNKIKDQYYNESTIAEENNQAVLEVQTSNIEEPQIQAKDEEQNNPESEQVVNIAESESYKNLQVYNDSFKEFNKTYKPDHPAIKPRKKSHISKLIKKRINRTIKKKSLKKTNQIKSQTENSEQVLENSKNPVYFEVKLESATAAIKNEDADAIVEENDVDDDVSDEDYEDTQSEPSKSKKTRKKNFTNLECTECNKKFQMYNSYRIHMRIHTGEKPYTCHICGKQFGQTGSLYYHLKHVHGGVKNHACDICGRCFAMKSAMEDHRRIHTGERPYVCDSCGKTFKTKASLYIHSKIHTNEYPFKCSYCKKLFRWKQQMVSHLTTHTGEKNHICDICGKGFGVKNELTRHRRTHSSDKPFTCQKCGVSFGQKRYLTNHVRTRHKTIETQN